MSRQYFRPSITSSQNILQVPNKPSHWKGRQATSQGHRRHKTRPKTSLVSWSRFFCTIINNSDNEGCTTAPPPWTETRRRRRRTDYHFLLPGPRWCPIDETTTRKLHVDTIKRKRWRSSPLIAINRPKNRAILVLSLARRQSEGGRERRHEGRA